MDAARVAKRMGAASSTIVYRRTKKEMPADEHELKLAIDEGVKLVELAAPVEQKDGKLVCNQMRARRARCIRPPQPRRHRRNV